MARPARTQSESRFAKGEVRMFVSRSLIAMSSLFSALALLGCSTSCMSRRSMSPHSAEATSTKPAPRPILYFASEGEGQGRELVIRAIHPDGRSLGTLARGYLGGWSRQGDRFAYWMMIEATQTAVVNVMDLGGRPEKVYGESGEKAFLGAGWKIWSPDGSMIALLLTGDDGRTFALAVVDVAKKKLVSTFKLPRSVKPESEEGPLDLLNVHVKWSPDGRKILVGSAALDLERNTWETIADRSVIAEWLPGSDGVYFFEVARQVGDLFLKKFGRNGAASVLTRSTLAGWGLAESAPLWAPVLKVSPSKSRLAIAARASPEEARTTVLAFDIAADRPGSLGEPAKRVRVDGILVEMAWGPDERQLAVLSLSPSGDLRVSVVDLDTGVSTSLAKAVHIEQLTDIDVVGILNTISWCD